MIKILLRKMRRDLKASLAQTIALITIVALGIASFIAVIGAYRDLGTSYSRTYDQLHFADVTFAVQSAPQDVVSQIGKINGVAAVTGRLIVDTGLQLPKSATVTDNEQIRARLIGITAGEHPQVNDVLITAGRYLTASDTNTVLLESHFAKAYNLAPGAQVMPYINGQTVSLQVAGVAASPEYLIVSASRQDVVPSARTFAVLFMPLSELQKLSGAGDTVSDIAVTLAPGADQAAVVTAIQNALDPYGLASTTLKQDQPSNAALKLDLAGYQEIGNMMPVLILFVAGASLYVMLSRQIRAQRGQIGLMKAVGYSSRVIVADYLTLALAIAVLGCLVGIAVGILLGKGITSGYAAELGIPLVQTKFYPDLALLGVAFSLIMAGLSGWAPARRAARVAPATAMRPNAAEALVAGKPSIVERWLHLPLWLRIPLRNVTRVRSRSLSTAMGVLFAFILVLASWGMIDSMQYVLQHTFHTVERWDMIALFDQPQPAAILQHIQQLPGVRAAEPLLQLPVTVKANNQSQDIVLTAIQPSQTMHLIELQNGLTPAQALANGQVVLTTNIAGKLKLHSGGKLTLDTPLGSRQVILGGITDELMSSVGYVSLDAAQTWAGAPVFNGMYLTADAAQAQAIQSEVYHLPGVASAQRKSTVQSDWASLMGLFYAFMGVLVAFALAMSFALLFNTMTVNVLEQQRELATMRAVGASRGLLASLMITENVILWLATLVPGLLLGYLVAQGMGAAFQSDLFAFKMVIAPTTYIFTALGILATMILAVLPAVRRVNRLDLAQATKVLT
jgi:putative ABC transport system permease protein